MSRWKKYGPIIGLALLGALSVGMAFLKAEGGTVRVISGGTFEASGVVFVGGGVLFVDDGRADTLFWMPLDGEGQQAGSATSIALGASIRDMEGITTDGTFIYVVGSQSKKDSEPGAGLARFRFDRQALRATDVEIVAELRTLLLNEMPALKAASGSRADGFNIEGLAWDRQRGELLLGLRAPVVDGQALVIPLRLRNDGPLTRENLVVDKDAVQRLSLDGAGVRSIEYDEADGAYRLISGATRNKEAPFAVWRWERGQQPVRNEIDAAILARELKPEGIAGGALDGVSYTFIVFDGGQFAALR